MIEIIVLIFLILAFLLWRLWRQFWLRCEHANQVDWGGKWVNRIDGFSRLLSYRYHRLEFDPIPLPESGPAVVVANHISGLDPLLLVAAVQRPLRFLIAREEYERFGLTWLFRRAGCIPVDRDKRPERAMRQAMEALERGEVVALFPHGGIVDPTSASKKIKGGAVRLAHNQGCKIYPAHIDGIKGVGHTLLALPLRSRARITALPVLDCSQYSYEECVNLLAQLLNKPLVGMAKKEEKQNDRNAD